MTKRQQNIVKEMDVLIGMKVLEKSGNKGRREKNEGRKEYESEDNEGLKEGSKHHRTAMDGSTQGIDNFHKNLRKIEEGAGKEKVSVEKDVDMKGEKGVSEEGAMMSDEDKFEVDTTTQHMKPRSISHADDESIPDSVNLIDLLYNEGCISIRHKQQIEQQPTHQLQNIEMFQLIKNGSIKTLKLAKDYFVRTGQRNVFERMNKQYHIEGKIIIVLVTKIKTSRVTVWSEFIDSDRRLNQKHTSVQDCRSTWTSSLLRRLNIGIQVTRTLF